MNANQFLNLRTLEQIQECKVFPSFSAVISKLNADPEHIFFKILPEAETLSERLYLAINNCQPFKCYCGNLTRFKTIKQGYSTYCSLTCRDLDKSVKQKRKDTNIKKYGCENAGQSAHIKNKIKVTNQLRYGVESTLADPNVIEKSKITKKILQHEITQKTIASNLEKYGVPCTLNCDSIKEKVRHTLLERYGVIHNSQIKEVKDKKRLQLFSYRKKSFFEDDVVSAIRKLGYTGEIVRNTRSIINPMELDIWIPELKLGIECNGCYWHSDPWKPKDYHKIKTDAVEQIGGKLIQLLDFEWNYKNAIVLHRLRSALCLADKVYARKCDVRKISLNEANTLIAAVHIQGPALAKHNYGLFENNELVAVMNFSKPRFTKKFEYELIRYASTKTVVGGASKLLKAFINDIKPSNIVTYADRRWSNGNLYKQLGFNLKHISSPGYWYFKGKEFKHRAVFQKHKLEQLLPIFDKSLGEVENMYANGWRRIFDSGNYVFSIEFK